MTRNNRLLIVLVALFGAALAAIKLSQRGSVESRRDAIVLFEPIPHPYCTAVGVGATAYARDSGTAVRIVVCQDGTQANVASNVESIVTLGNRLLAIYPVDPAGSRGLFARLGRIGCRVVAYGAQPEPGSDTAFAVATDTRKAATLAAEKLVELMGGSGRILDVLESSTDSNTAIRRAAVEEVVARHPGVSILQTVGDVTTEQKAREKIESALVARGGEIDGVICTGYTTTVAAAVLLSERHRRDPGHSVRFVGLDTDDRVLAAIRDGSIDATVAQNPFGHGYLSCALLDLMNKGWRPRSPYQFVDSGCLIVTRDNADAFPAAIERMTAAILADLRTRYLAPPAAAQ